MTPSERKVGQQLFLAGMIVGLIFGFLIGAFAMT